MNTEEAMWKLQFGPQVSAGSRSWPAQGVEHMKSPEKAIKAMAALGLG